MKLFTQWAGQQSRLLVLALAGGGGLAPLVARAQAPANDDPCGAVVLTAQGGLCSAPTTSTNQNATASALNGSVPANRPRDVWFRFTTAASGPASFGATLTVTGNPAGLVQLWQGPAGGGCTGAFAYVATSPLPGQGQSNTAAPRLITGALQANTTYFVQVAGFANTDATGPFTICLTDGPGTPTCLPPRITSVVQTAPGTVSIDFVPSQNSTPPYAYRFVGNGGGPRTGTTSTSPLVFTGVGLGPYTFTLGTACATGGQASGGTSGTLGPLNDDACGAIALPLAGTACAAPTAGSFAYASQGPLSFGSACTLFGTNNPIDVWYTVTTAASGPGSTSLTITGTGAVGLLKLFAGGNCASVGGGQELGCANGSGLPGVPPLTVTGLTPNTLYYVQAQQYPGGFQGSAFTLCATAPVSCAAPTNFYVGIVTTTTAPLIFSPGVGNTAYTVTYTPLGGTPQTATFGGLPFALSNLLPGTPYTLSLVGNCSGGLTSPPATFSFNTVLANDEPCAAVALPVNPTCTPTAATTDGATATAPNGYNGQGCGYPTSRDVWFRFTTPASGPNATGVTVSLPNGVSKQLRAFAAPACTGPFTELGCTFAPPGTNATNQNPVPPLSLSGLVPGTTYYLSVGEGNYFGLPDFSICIGNPPACPGPTALAVGSLTATSASLSFVPGAGNTAYTVTYQAAGGPVQTLTPPPTASPVALPNLLPGTAYTATVQAVCPAGLGLPATVRFTTPPLGLTNDECATAVPVPGVGVGTCGPPVAGSTTGATASAGVPAPGCAGSTYEDVWFRLTVPANGVLQVQTDAVAGSPLTDTGLALYGGTCGSLALLACDDDNGLGNFSLARATGLTPGATVYARVWTYGGTPAGAFTLCAQTDAACPAVTGLTAAGSGTTASIGFSGPPSASGYTLTYTAAGGSPLTLTPTAAPVSLSNLQLFTTYTVTVVANCGPGLSSAPVSTTFSTSPYCTAGLGGNCGSNDITSFAIAGTALANSGTVCATVNGNAYNAYPATGNTTADLGQGRSYALSIGTAGQSNADLMVWVDYDRDGVFSPAEGTQAALNTLPGLPARATLVVPATATPGRTGLRVRSRSAGSGNGPADACSGFGSGHTTDYLVTIVLATAARESALAAQVGVFPNPAAGSFTLALPPALSRQASTATLCNALGQVVRTQLLPARATGSETRFDVRELPAGVYVLRLPTAAGPVVKRLTLE